ncbi:hypothetical protein HDU76_012735 [Blyttiomyces sp. JEL0837]|nr:hypothetical protein HDU76_012735 [Blyttiomyces sp. JEL0837]
MSRGSSDEATIFPLFSDHIATLNTGSSLSASDLFGNEHHSVVGLYNPIAPSGSNPTVNYMTQVLLDWEGGRSADRIASSENMKQQSHLSHPPIMRPSPQGGRRNWMEDESAMGLHHDDGAGVNKLEGGKGGFFAHTSDDTSVTPCTSGLGTPTKDHVDGPESMLCMTDVFRSHRSNKYDATNQLRNRSMKEIITDDMVEDKIGCKDKINFSDVMHADCDAVSMNDGSIAPVASSADGIPPPVNHHLPQIPAHHFNNHPAAVAFRQHNDLSAISLMSDSTAVMDDGSSATPTHSNKGISNEAGSNKPTIDLSSRLNDALVKSAVAERLQQQQHQQSLGVLDNSKSPSGGAGGKHKRERNRSHTPRPSNSFILYRREKHAEIMSQYKGAKALNNNVISKIVATMWRQEEPDVKAKYAAKAEEEKKAHMLKYPDYKYRPRKNPHKAGSKNAANAAVANAAGTKNINLAAGNMGSLRMPLPVGIGLVEDAYGHALASSGRNGVPSMSQPMMLGHEYTFQSPPSAHSAHSANQHAQAAAMAAAAAASNSLDSINPWSPHYDPRYHSHQSHLDPRYHTHHAHSNLLSAADSLSGQGVSPLPLYHTGYESLNPDDMLMSPFFQPSPSHYQHLDVASGSGSSTVTSAAQKQRQIQQQHQMQLSGSQLQHHNSYNPFYHYNSRAGNGNAAGGSNSTGSSNLGGKNVGSGSHGAPYSQHAHAAVEAAPSVSSSNGGRCDDDGLNGCDDGIHMSGKEMGIGGKDDMGNEDNADVVVRKSGIYGGYAAWAPRGQVGGWGEDISVGLSDDDCIPNINV